MVVFKECLILLLVFIPKGFSQDYSVTALTTSPGLYYEKIGEVLLSNSNWEFVTALDYKAYLLFYEYLLQQARQLDTFCETVNSSSCKQRYERIETQLDRIEKTHESLANFLGVSIKPRRVKRFWAEIGNFFKGVGKAIIGKIFEGGSGHTDLSGVENAISNLQSGQQILQNEVNLQRTLFLIDSERKTLAIDSLKKNQDEIQNKISSLESTVNANKAEQERELNALKATLADVQVKLKEQEEIQKKLNGKVNDIENKLIEVDKDIKDIKEKIDKNRNDIELINKLILIFDHFQFIREEFEKHQDHLLSVVNKVNGGTMDSYIVTPSSLVEMLQDIQPNLPEGTTFPYYPNIDNAKHLYNVIKPSVYLFNCKLIFILKIPLVYSKRFNIHKMTSLPIGIGYNKFVFILPQEPYIIIDNKYQEYMLMSRDNFKSYCEVLQTGKYRCNQIQEILNSYSSDECEVNLLKSAKEVPKSCNTRIMHLNKSLFFQLQQSTSWIYVAPETENIVVACNDIRETKPLTGTGFIRGNKDCSFRTPQFELSSLDAFREPVQSNFTSPLNLPDFIDVSQYSGIEMKGKKSFQQLFPFEFAKLEEASYRITESQMSLLPLYLFLLIIFLIIIVVASALAYLKYKKKISLRQQYSATYEYFMNLFRKTETSTPLQSNSVDDNTKIKIKVNNPNDLQDVSIYGRPSETDPDSEYFTVKFKVKNDKNPPTVPQQKMTNNKLNGKGNHYETSKEKGRINEINLQKENDPPKILKEERYLQALRKIKPNLQQ